MLFGCGAALIPALTRAPEGLRGPHVPPHELLNEILRLGCHLKAEEVSCRAWQEVFGRSTAHCTPGMFMDRAKRKAESACSSLCPISTGKTALYLPVHGSGEKPRSLRWHRCWRGVRARAGP
jgi:hypothetical protein